jgi:hypothetical protein
MKLLSWNVRMGRRLWWKKASDREEWRKLLMETKTLFEL